MLTYTVRIFTIFDLNVGEGLMLMKVLFPFCGTLVTPPR